MKAKRAKSRKLSAGEPQRGRSSRSLQQRLDTARLESWAQSLMGGVPYPDALPHQLKRQLPELCLGELERWEIARYLYELAQMPRVLEAVIKARPRPTKKRGRRSTGRTWKIALDYRLTRMRRTLDKVALGEVMDAWKVRRTVVKDALTECQKKPQWRHWAQYEMRSERAADPSLRGNALRLKVSEKMRGPDNSR